MVHGSFVKFNSGVGSTVAKYYVQDVNKFLSRKYSVCSLQKAQGRGNSMQAATFVILVQMYFSFMISYEVFSRMKF